MVCAMTAGFLLVVAGLAHAAPVELVVWEHEFPEVQATLDKVLKDFEAAHQNIKIKRAHYKTEDLRSQFQTAAMGGGGADLVLAPNDFAGPFSVMGIIQPVKAWGNLARFDETVVKAVTDAKGEVWGLPVSRGNHLMLFVNGKTLKAAPSTVEEMVKLAREQTDAGKSRYGLAYNLNEPFWFVSFLGAYGEQPLVGGKPQLAGKGMEGALALVKDLKFKDKVVPQDCDYACAETLFVEGKTPMLINGDWALQKYQDTLGKDLVIAPLPKLEATGKHMAPMVSGKYFFFNAKLKGDKLEAAKKLAEYFVSEPVQEHLTKETKRLPSLRSLAQSAVITGDPVLKATSDALAHGQPMPMEVEMRAVWDAMRPQLQAVMAGRAEPHGAAAVMQKDAETKIMEMR
jgi:arabinogalactan oligomer/maltooligosaccharide transport system substrate-binding protein